MESALTISTVDIREDLVHLAAALRAEQPEPRPAGGPVAAKGSEGAVLASLADGVEGQQGQQGAESGGQHGAGAGGGRRG